MPTTDPRVDAYIARSAEFARPILERIRAIVHEACPDCVEDMKWNFPHFGYHGMLAGMAAFKAHCTFGYWNAERVVDGDARSGDAMGQLGRLKSVADLPPKATLIRWTRKAMALNDAGIKPKRANKPRLTTAIEWIAVGKSRNWKYE